MRLTKKEKIMLYNESLFDRKCHLESIIFDEGLDSDREDGEFIEDIKEELKIIYKVMRKIEKDLNGEGLDDCDYEYEKQL